MRDDGKAREYRGVSIHRHPRNSMGLRWRAADPTGRGHELRSDTLEGMRQLIRDALTVRDGDYGNPARRGSVLRTRSVPLVQTIDRGTCDVRHFMAPNLAAADAAARDYAERGVLPDLPTMRVGWL